MSYAVVQSRACRARPFSARPPTTAGHEALCSAPLVRPARGRGRRLGRRRWRGADHSASLSCRRRSGAAADDRGSPSLSARSARHPVAAGHEALCSAPLVRPARGCGRRVGRRRLRGADYSASQAVGDASEPPSPFLVTALVPCACFAVRFHVSSSAWVGFPLCACATRLSLLRNSSCCRRP